MALSVADMKAVRAVWEEWVSDDFALSIEVRDEGASVAMSPTGGLGARVTSSLYLQVEVVCEMAIARGHRVFSERVPYDADALRASVTVLARTIAAGQDLGLLG